MKLIQEVAMHTAMDGHMKKALLGWQSEQALFLCPTQEAFLLVECFLCNEFIICIGISTFLVTQNMFKMSFEQWECFV